MDVIVNWDNHGLPRNKTSYLQTNTRWHIYNTKQYQQLLFSHQEPQHFHQILGSLGVRAPGPYLTDLLQLPSNSNV